MRFRIYHSTRSTQHRAFPANISEVTGLPLLWKPLLQIVICSLKWSIGPGWWPRWAVPCGPGEERRGRDLILLHLLSPGRPLQTGHRRKSVLETSPCCNVSWQERFWKTNSLNRMCCRVIQALLELLKRFPFVSEMPVLPGQVLSFMAPDGTENSWVWIQLMKMTDRNTVLCCQLSSGTGKGMHWIICSVVICYLKMLSQVHLCNKIHDKKFSTASTT